MAKSTVRFISETTPRTSRSVRVGTQSTCQCSKRLSRLQRGCRFMSLPHAVLRGSPLNAQVPPTSGHPCLMQGNSCDIRPTRALRNSFVLDSYSLFGIGIARALSSCSEAAAS
jgi:hypothetical protein